MVTAIPATEAKGITLSHSDIVLRDAGGEELKTLGAFEACIGLQTRSAVGTIYVVQGLSHPLLSRTSMKELGLLHPMFPHHLTTQEMVDEKTPSSGVIQSLVIETHPLKTNHKKVRFGPPQGQSDKKMSRIFTGTRQKTTMSKKTKWPQEPVHASETDMSSDEDEPHHNKFNVVEQIHGTPTIGYEPTRLKQTGGPQTLKKAIRPRPEAALVCGQNISKRPTGPHLRVDIRHIAVPTRSNVAPLVLRGGFIGQKKPTAVRSEKDSDAGCTCGPTAMKAKKTPPREGYKSPKISKESNPIEQLNIEPKEARPRALETIVKEPKSSWRPRPRVFNMYAAHCGRGRMPF
jgi:hypothetical protein